MTDPKHRDQLHDELQALFDQSAQAPSKTQSDRMARAAAQIPSQSTARWFDVLRRRPALALGLATAAAAGAFWISATPLSIFSDSTVIVAEHKPTTSPTIASSSPPESTNSDQDDSSELWIDDDPIAALSGDAVDDDPILALDLLHGPSENDDEVGWALAYEAALQGG